jgi:regulator of replication initiation timing
MRDTRSLLLLLVSLLLVAVSFVLIWTWGYNYYSKKDEVKNSIAMPDANTIAEHIRDSLQKAYTATLKELDTQLDSTLNNSDSLRSQLDVKLAEFYRLRAEITELLKNRSTNNNYAVAKQKIGELQTKVDDLQDKNRDVENENRKLATVIEQIKTAPANPPVTGKTVTQSKPAGTYNNLSQPFTASDLRLAAVMNADDNEVETNLAEKTEKLNGSFTVMNFNSQQTNAEMMVVVLKPDGRVLKTSWDSGTFSTAEGKKIYSYKFNFTYSRGESKRLLFSLKGGNLVKGNYTMEVYHNGQLIGRMVKTLS